MADFEKFIRWAGEIKNSIRLPEDPNSLQYSEWAFMGDTQSFFRDNNCNCSEPLMGVYTHLLLIIQMSFHLTDSNSLLQYPKIAVNDSRLRSNTEKITKIWKLPDVPNIVLAEIQNEKGAGLKWFRIDSRH